MKAHRGKLSAVAALFIAAGLISCAEKGSSLFPLETIPGFLYVVGDADVGGFTVNQDTGVVSSAGASVTSAFSPGPCPDLAAANPEGTLLIVPDDCNSNIVVFHIDQKTGALSAATGSPFAVSSAFTLEQPAVHPSGKFLYVGEDSVGQVLGFQLGVDGTLVAMSCSPFAAGGEDEAIAIHPNGKFLFASDSVSPGTITVFLIDPASGCLTPILGSPFPAGNGVRYIAIHPQGAFLYAVGDNNIVFAFNVDRRTGALSPVAGSPFPSGDNNPNGIDVSVDGKFLFVANKGDVSAAVTGSVSVFAIDQSTGVPTPIAGSPFASALNPFFLAADPSGQFLYVTNEDSGMSVFKIDPHTGALGEIAGSPFTTNVGPTGVVIVHR